MLTRTITCKDYNGVEYTQTYYFNLNKAEITKMQLGTLGGLTTAIKNAVDAKDVPTITKMFNDIILAAYGKISDDGKRFIKSPELRAEFEQSEAYNILFMEVATDGKKAEEFFKGVFPEVPEEAKKELSLPVHYEVQAERGLAFARNKVLKTALEKGFENLATHIENIKKLLRI